MTVVCGAGNLTHRKSPACLYILLSFSLLLTLVCGAGNLTRGRRGAWAPCISNMLGL